MIKSVKESYISRISDENDKFWSYYIFHADSGKEKRYNLIRIDNVCENMEVLGRGLTLLYCEQIIAKKEIDYPTNRRMYTSNIE